MRNWWTLSGAFWTRRRAPGSPLDTSSSLGSRRFKRYVRRELQVLFAQSADGEARERINALEQPFGGPVSSAIERRLNRLQKQGVKGEELLRELEELYSRYRMYEAPPRRAVSREDDTFRIVCSEALI